jgi:acylphosphatase
VGQPLLRLSDGSLANAAEFLLKVEPALSIFPPAAGVRNTEKGYAPGGNYGIMRAMQQNNETQELYARVQGYVQGVGFRQFVLHHAAALGLRGYVRNLRDGSVEVLAQGPRAALEQLHALLWRGPAAAEVHAVQAEWREPGGHFSGFHVRW